MQMAADDKKLKIQLVDDYQSAMQAVQRQGLRQLTIELLFSNKTVSRSIETTFKLESIKDHQLKCSQTNVFFSHSVFYLDINLRKFLIVAKQLVMYVHYYYNTN